MEHEVRILREFGGVQQSVELHRSSNGAIYCTFIPQPHCGHVILSLAKIGDLYERLRAMVGTSQAVRTT